MTKPLTKVEKEKSIELFTDASTKQVALLKLMNVRPEMFTRVCCNALIRNPDLARCNRASLFEAVYKAIEFGLMPDGKHGALVPIKNRGVLTAQFWPMIDGLLTKVRKNIPGIALQSNNVFGGDEFFDERGSHPKLVHIPDPEVDRTFENLFASYATAHMPGNEIPEVEVMYRRELVDYVKDNRGPWATHPLQMIRLRPFKRLLNRLPISSGLAAHLEGLEDGWETEFEDAEFETIPVETAPAPAPAPAQPKTRTTRRTNKTAGTKTQTKRQTKPAQQQPPEPQQVQQEEADLNIHAGMEEIDQSAYQQQEDDPF